MRRILLSPAWWGRHLLMVVLVVAFALLGRWQWDRAMSPTGSFQNLLYAIEWWVFAGLVVVGWWHLARDELRAAAGRLPAPVGPPPDDLPAFAVRQILPAGRVPADDPTEHAADAELAAYNEYLAWLNAHPRR